jgi:heat shock protein HslJ
VRFAGFISIPVMLGIISYGCTGAAYSSSSAKTAPIPTAQATPPTLDEMKSATYTGVGESLGAVTLQNGRWSGPPSVPSGASRPTVELAGDFRVVGDLNGDGVDEAVSVLTYSSGGSGSLSYLAVMQRGAGTIRNVATTALGDRVQLRSVRVQGGKLLASGLRAGSSDAACCPGELVQWEWTLRNGALNSSGAVRTGRLSLAVLSGSEWMLRAWNINEPAGAEPAVTLAYEAGRFSGSSGCNRYTGGVTEGTTAGELSVGLLAGTRMACPDAAASVETRFMEQLTGAKTYGFMLGRLAISYSKADGSRGTMLFDSKTPLQ